MQVSTTWFTTSTSLFSGAAYAVALNFFSDYASYTSLFDEYKIDLLEAWVDPSLINSSTVGSTLYHTCVDLDDANTPANAADVAARQGVVTSLTGTGHYHKWRPYVANALYSGAFTSYGSEPSPWIDCASPGVQHFGLKGVTNAADGVARAMNLTIRALVSFRGSSI